MDDLAQYSPRRRPRRFAEPEEPFRFQTPLVFTVAPVARLNSEAPEKRCLDPLRVR
jgi:hypothetical protein